MRRRGTRTKTRAVRFRLAKNGTATIAGLSFEDARSLITSANLQAHASLARCQEELRLVKLDPSDLHDLKIENAEASLRWAKAQMHWAQELSAKCNEALDKHNGTTAAVLGLKETLRANQTEREEFASFLEAILKEKSHDVPQ